MERIYILIKDLDYARRFIQEVETYYKDRYKIIELEKLEDFYLDEDSFLLTDKRDSFSDGVALLVDDRKIIEEQKNSILIYKYQSLTSIFSQLDNFIVSLDQRTKLINMINLDFSDRSTDFNDGLYRRLARDYRILVINLNSLCYRNFSDDELGLETLVMSGKIGGDIEESSVVNRGRDYDYINPAADPNLFFELTEDNIFNIIKQVKRYDYNLIFLEFNFSFFNNFLILFNQASKNIIKTIHKLEKGSDFEEIKYLKEKAVLTKPYRIFSIGVEDFNLRSADLTRSEKYKRMIEEVIAFVNE